MASNLAVDLVMLIASTTRVANCSSMATAATITKIVSEVSWLKVNPGYREFGGREFRLLAFWRSCAAIVLLCGVHCCAYIFTSALDPLAQLLFGLGCAIAEIFRAFVRRLRDVFAQFASRLRGKQDANDGSNPEPGEKPADITTNAIIIRHEIPPQ